MTRKKSAAPSWPKFDAPILTGISAALLRRHKALAHKADFASHRDFNESANGTFERLTIDVHEAASRLIICLQVWSDGAMWLGVWTDGRGRGARRKHHEQFFGQAQDVSPEWLVGLIESTLLVAAAGRKELRKLWAQVRPYDE